MLLFSINLMRLFIPLLRNYNLLIHFSIFDYLWYQSYEINECIVIVYERGVSVYFGSKASYRIFLKSTSRFLLLLHQKPWKLIVSLWGFCLIPSNIGFYSFLATDILRLLSKKSIPIYICSLSTYVPIPIKVENAISFSSSALQ